MNEKITVEVSDLLWERLLPHASYPSYFFNIGDIGVITWNEDNHEILIDTRAESLSDLRENNPDGFIRELGKIERTARALQFQRLQHDFSQSVRVQAQELLKKREAVQQPPTQQPRGVSGTVYLLRGSHGFYKIGRTRSGRLENRISEISRASGLDIESITSFEVEDCVQAESELHSLFAHCRKNGEWFDLTEDDVRTVRERAESERVTVQ